MATLLPKLRVHFAEFLNESSHKRLRILAPPTCVGLRYGQITVRAARGFSWQLGSVTFFGFYPYFRPPPYPDVTRIYQSDGLCVFNRISITGLTYPIASPHGTATGSGILTGFPSTTPFGLALGTDLP